MNTNVLEIALKALSTQFDEFISECLDEKGNIKQPSQKAIMRAKASLPPYCKNCFTKK